MEQKLPGLPNLGQTCFINSAIQSIANVWDSGYFATGKYRDDMNTFPDTKEGWMNEFAHRFAYLVSSLQNKSSLWKKEHTHNNMMFLYFKIFPLVSQLKQFTDKSQHDAHDFLICLIEEISRVLSYNIHWEVVVACPESELGITDKLKLKSYESIKREYKNRYSNVTALFGGQFCVITSCQNKPCNNQTHSFDCFNSISLPVKDTTTLPECFNAFFRQEQLDEKNMWNCDKCHVKNQAIKTNIIWKAPVVLIIHFRRFENDGRYLRKLDNNIDYPLTNFDLGEWVFTLTDKKYIYNLTGICYHMGNLNGGHYTAARKENGEWWYFDDDACVKLDAKMMAKLNKFTYYLIYRKTQD